ncbi:MAG TPA: hypothetical protein VHT96_03220 [Clostridia bacterium]|nr:hypothetical protein [Clostridia bacterium]
MDEWSADYGNNPYDDYNLIVEILYQDRDVAVIYKSENELKLKYYANENDLVIPLDWLLGLLKDVKERLDNNSSF